jgi:hypothetical protein
MSSVGATAKVCPRGVGVPASPSPFAAGWDDQAGAIAVANWTRPTTAGGRIQARPADELLGSPWRMP